MTKIDVCRSLAAGSAVCLTVAFSYSFRTLFAVDKLSHLDDSELQAIAKMTDSETTIRYRRGLSEWRDKDYPLVIG